MLRVSSSRRRHCGVRDRVREHEAELARVGQRPPAELHGRGDQPPGVVVGGQLVGGRGEPLGGGLVDLERHQVDQLLVAGDVAVERRRGHPHPAGDRPQRQLGALGEQLAGGAARSRRTSPRAGVRGGSAAGSPGLRSWWRSSYSWAVDTREFTPFTVYGVNQTDLCSRRSHMIERWGAFVARRALAVLLAGVALTSRPRCVRLRGLRLAVPGRVRRPGLRVRARAGLERDTFGNQGVDVVAIYSSEDLVADRPGVPGRGRADLAGYADGHHRPVDAVLRRPESRRRWSATTGTPRRC